MIALFKILACLPLGLARLLGLMLGWAALKVQRKSGVTKRSTATRNRAAVVASTEVL